MVMQFESTLRRKGFSDPNKSIIHWLERPGDAYTPDQIFYVRGGFFGPVKIIYIDRGLATADKFSVHYREEPPYILQLFGQMGRINRESNGYFATDGKSLDKDAEQIKRVLRL